MALVKSAVTKAINQGSNPGYLTFSGTGPVSGVSGVGAFSGPFYVETQVLTYTYKRVPNFRFTKGEISLSSMNNSLNTYSTHLLVRIDKATVTREKVYDWYETSSYIQPQRFTLYSASSDETGQTYGTPAAGTMCVGGLVDTTQPWYFRRPWDTSLGDNESDMGVFPLEYETETPNQWHNWLGDAYNYVAESSITCGVSSTPETPIDYPWSDSLFWLCFPYTTEVSIKGQTAGFPGQQTCEQTIPGAGGFKATSIETLLYLGHHIGTYSVDQDDVGDTQQTTDAIADSLSLTSSVERRWVKSPDGARIRQNHYAKSRHYWGG
tara:strand:+ start:3438 stop:4403 length:966 start_codon:yes stop_codon:yes gene_type:complete